MPDQDVLTWPGVKSMECNSCFIDRCSHISTWL